MKDWVYVGLVKPAGHDGSAARLLLKDFDCAQVAVIPVLSEQHSLWSCTLLSKIAKAVWQPIQQGAAAQIALL